MKCGRRDELGNINLPKEDGWFTRHGIEQCSYCGSVKPEQVFDSIERGLEITPTDKNYKIYLEVIDPLGGKERIVSVANFNPGDQRIASENWIQINDKVREDLKRDGWSDRNDKSDTFVQYTTRGFTTTTKFYFQHFSDDDKHKFITLYNEKKIKLAYPGHFYRLPFFMKVIG